jgi:RNA polymerase sigma factor (sigma-70 family)
MADFWVKAYEAHAPMVLGFLSRRLPASPGDAEDLLQETFVRAIRAQTAAGPAWAVAGRPFPLSSTDSTDAAAAANRVDPASEEGTALRRYLLTVARNLLFNRGRHLRVVRKVEVASVDQDAAAHDWAAALSNPEEEASWSRFRGDLDAALAELSADLSLAFRLALVERHTYDEIVAATGWTLARVKTNVFRARRRVIERLADRLPVEGARA